MITMNRVLCAANLSDCNATAADPFLPEIQPHLDQMRA
jgi:hypothetical protein